MFKVHLVHGCDIFTVNYRATCRTLGTSKMVQTVIVQTPIKTGDVSAGAGKLPVCRRRPMSQFNRLTNFSWANVPAWYYINYQVMHHGDSAGNPGLNDAIRGVTFPGIARSSSLR